MTRPVDCPECDAPFALRNGVCAHCGFEEPAESRGHWPDRSTREIGLEGVRQARAPLRKQKALDEYPPLPDAVVPRAGKPNPSSPNATGTDSPIIDDQENPSEQ